MTEADDQVDELLTDAVAFTDPIQAVFDINDQMLVRITRLRYVFLYAFWAGIVASFGAALGLLWVVITGPDINVLVLLVGVLLASLVAFWFARSEGPFLSEYQVIAGAVSRAKDWQPHPQVPEGKDHLSRYVKFLEEQDDRFGFYYEKNHENLRLDSNLKGTSKTLHHFDATFASSSFPWDDIDGSVRILIRAIPHVTESDILSMKKAAEDVIPRAWVAHWVFKPASVRIILLQTGDSDFSEEIIKLAEKNRVEHERDVGGVSYEWSAPIELVAEDPSGVYNFGTVYFG
jgi:hypothetical protein